MWVLKFYCMNVSQVQFSNDTGQVRTVHILKTGEHIDSLEEFQKFEERFSWVNRSEMIRKLFQLRSVTDIRKQSVIAIYEDGRKIREFVNVEREFKPLNYY